MMATLRTETKKKPFLQKGQIWQLGECRIQIVEVGRTLTHYKQFKTPLARSNRIELKQIVAMESMLRENKAKLSKSL